jgi:hypothetical protein
MGGAFQRSTLKHLPANIGSSNGYYPFALSVFLLPCFQSIGLHHLGTRTGCYNPRSNFGSLRIGVNDSKSNSFLPRS